jgi:hypothetical protein
LKHIDTIHKFTISVLILILVQACSKESFTSQENASSAPSPNLNISYDCTIGNETVLENDSKLFYLKSSVPYGSTCQSENRTCRRGFFAGTYQYTTCDIDAPPSCLHNGATIAHGQSISAFLQSSVPYGQSCVQQTRTCNNGIRFHKLLSWSRSKLYFQWFKLSSWSECHSVCYIDSRFWF